MKKPVVVVDSDKKQCQGLCDLLAERNYPTIPKHSLLALNSHIQAASGGVVILDIDTISVDNRTIKEMVIKNPGTYFLCLSKDRFHPELKDAICYHIYACVNKPADPDEIFYWLKAIYEDESL